MARLLPQMVLENDRLWTVPREMLKATAPAVDRLREVHLTSSARKSRDS
jgi:hypothetical protein